MFCLVARAAQRNEIVLLVGSMLRQIDNVMHIENCIHRAAARAAHPVTRPDAPSYLGPVARIVRESVHAQQAATVRAHNLEVACAVFPVCQ